MLHVTMLVELSSLDPELPSQSDSDRSFYRWGDGWVFGNGKGAGHGVGSTAQYGEERRRLLLITLPRIDFESMPLIALAAKSHLQTV